jgi:hypothetical protein
MRRARYAAFEWPINKRYERVYTAVRPDLQRRRGSDRSATIVRISIGRRPISRVNTLINESLPDCIRVFPRSKLVSKISLSRGRSFIRFDVRVHRNFDVHCAR